jgi:hypothetical protein
MTNKEQLLVRAKSIMEATLGGEKYKGKENPNNEKKRNPGDGPTKLGKRWKNMSRADDAADKHRPQFANRTNSHHKRAHHFWAVKAAEKVRPN